MNNGLKKWQFIQRASVVYKNLYCCYYSTRNRRRVVVTGLGTVCPLGVGSRYVWKELIAGKCGITKILDEGYGSIPAKIAAFIPRGSDVGQLEVEKWYSVVDKRSTAEESLYAMIAATEALEDCGWKPATEEDKQRTGVSIGCGIGGIKEIPVTGALLKKEGYRKVSPFFVPRILGNMPAGVVSIHFGLQGPNHAVSTACAAGAHAIGDAFRMITNNDADVMLAGGTESCITPLSMAGFCKARALTTKFNEKPLEASRPFDKDRSGFVIGEGAGVIVLEEFNHAVSRGADIYAELLGYGMSGDAYHITAPREDGQGAYLAMSAALRDASVHPFDVTYINAHATSTPIGDTIESRAIKRLLGEETKGTWISSTKGATGHLLGAAGAVEAIFTILAIKEKMVPPTLNLHSFDFSEDVHANYVTNTAQELITDQPSTSLIALTNSFGFGGTNASLCFAEVK